MLAPLFLVCFEIEVFMLRKIENGRYIAFVTGSQKMLYRKCLYRYVGSCVIVPENVILTFSSLMFIKKGFLFTCFR